MDGTLGDGSPDTVSAWSAGILFDPAALSFNIAEFEFTDLGLGGLTAGGATLVGAGAIQLDVIDLFGCAFGCELQPDMFTLATLTFNVLNLAPETSTLVNIDPGFGGAFTTFNGGPGPGGLFTEVYGLDPTFPIEIIGTISATIQGRSISQVPEPTTLALLSLGLAGLGFTRRRMKA